MIERCSAIILHLTKIKRISGIHIRDIRKWKDTTLREYVNDCTAEDCAKGLNRMIENYNSGIQITYKLYTDEEIAALGVEKREVVVGYQVGDNVKITDGALESFLGTVEEIDLDRSKVRVVVSMFGRETPVELELDQVEPVQD